MDKNQMPNPMGGMFGGGSKDEMKATRYSPLVIATAARLTWALDVQT